MDAVLDNVLSSQHSTNHSRHETSDPCLPSANNISAFYRDHTIPNNTSVMYREHATPNNTSVMYREHAMPNNTSVMYREHATPNNASVMYREHITPNNASIMYREHMTPSNSSISYVDHATPNNASIMYTEHATPNTNSALFSDHITSNTLSVSNLSAADQNSPDSESSVSDGERPSPNNIYISGNDSPNDTTVSDTENTSPVNASVSATEHTSPVNASVSDAEHTSPVNASVSDTECTSPVHASGSDTEPTAMENSTGETSTDIVDATTSNAPEDNASGSSTSLSILSKLLPKSAFSLKGVLPTPRRRSRQLTLEEKVDLIEDSDTLSLRKLAIRYDIGRKPVRNIIRRKKEILKQYYSNKPVEEQMRHYTLQKGNDQIDLLTWQWHQRLREVDIPVTGVMCQQKAREFARELRMDDFKGSNGWLQGFRRRHKLKFTTRSPEKKPAPVDNMKLPDTLPDDIAQLLQEMTASSTENISEATGDASENSKQSETPVTDDKSSDQSHIELPPNVSQMQQNNPEWAEWNRFIDSTFNEMAKRVLVPGPQSTGDNYNAMAQNYTMAAFSGSIKSQDAATSFRPPQAFPAHGQQMSAFPPNQRRELIHEAHGLPSCQLAPHMESYPQSSHVHGRELWPPIHTSGKESYPPLPHVPTIESAKPTIMSMSIEGATDNVQSDPNIPIQGRTMTDKTSDSSACKKQKLSEEDNHLNGTSVSASEKTNPMHVQLDNLYDVLRATHQLTLFFRRTSESHLCDVFEQAENEVRNDILSQRSHNT